MSDGYADVSNDAKRRLAAGVRINAHGVIVGGAFPHLVPVDALEAYADELDRKDPDKAIQWIKDMRA